MSVNFFWGTYFFSLNGRFIVVNYFSPRGSFSIFHLRILKHMNINIQTVHFDADSKLKSHITQKLEKLQQFHDRITKVDVYLKLDNLVHTIKDKIVEIKVAVPKHEFFVKYSCKSFEQSFDEAMGAIVNQIKRRKEKLAV